MREAAGLGDDARRAGDERALQPHAQGAPPLRSAVLGRDHVAGDGEQPGQGVGGHLIEPPPGDQKGLGDDIFRVTKSPTDATPASSLMVTAKPVANAYTMGNERTSPIVACTSLIRHA